MTIIVFVKAYWLPILVTSHAYRFHDPICLVLCQALKPNMPKCNVPNTLPKSSAMTLWGAKKLQGYSAMTVLQMPLWPPMPCPKPVCKSLMASHKAFVASHATF